jgi:class 3 adenylate cyclase
LRVARAFHAVASIVQVPSSADDAAWKSKSLKVRTGLHSGSLTSGIVGRDRARYSLFGETVNTAARMESTAAAAQIQVSES